MGLELISYLQYTFICNKNLDLLHLTFFATGASVLEEILNEINIKVRNLEEKYKKKMEEKGMVSPLVL